MSKSAYALRMARLSNRIFSEVPANMKNRSGLDPKVTRIFAEKPLDKRPEIVDYYPKHIDLSGLLLRLRSVGLYRDEHRDFVDEMRRQRALRGKTKPKKGEGKRASNKKR